MHSAADESHSRGNERLAYAFVCALSVYPTIDFSIAAQTANYQLSERILLIASAQTMRFAVRQFFCVGGRCKELFALDPSTVTH
jgi:hypothetical protein